MLNVTAESDAYVGDAAYRFFHQMGDVYAERVSRWNVAYACRNRYLVQQAGACSLLPAQRVENLAA